MSVIVRVNRTCKLNWMIWNKSFNCLVFCPSVWFYELYSFMCSNYGEQFHGICVIRPISISIDVKVLFGHHPRNINGLIVRCADKMCSGYYSVAATIVIIALSFLLAIATVALDSSGHTTQNNTYIYRLVKGKTQPPFTNQYYHPFNLIRKW